MTQMRRFYISTNKLFFCCDRTEKNILVCLCLKCFMHSIIVPHSIQISFFLFSTLLSFFSLYTWILCVRSGPKHKLFAAHTGDN